MKQIKLCDPREQTGCPIVTISEMEIIIQDDNGGKIVLTPRQWKILQKSILGGDL